MGVEQPANVAVFSLFDGGPITLTSIVDQYVHCPEVSCCSAHSRDDLGGIGYIEFFNERRVRVAGGEVCLPSRRQNHIVAAAEGSCGECPAEST